MISLPLIIVTASLLAAPSDVVLPKNQILVKGAVPASSDDTVQVPESGAIAASTYRNPYFGLVYAAPAGWQQQADGPRPSDTGSYVLAQFAIYDAKHERMRANVLLTAQDLFFTPVAVTSGPELLDALRKSLSPNFAVDPGPTELTIAGRHFARLAYTSPVAGLHWRVLSTDVRCHALRFTFTGTDPKLLDAAEKSLSIMDLSALGSDAPPCVANYADRVVEKTTPHLAGNRFNTIPARIVIDEQGRVKSVHILSAFPDQSTEILTALKSWRFEPYVHDGRAEEVETGITFGYVPRLSRK
jgi:hypothetical protein